MKKAHGQKQLANVPIKRKNVFNGRKGNMKWCRKKGFIQVSMEHGQKDGKGYGSKKAR